MKMNSMASQRAKRFHKLEDDSEQSWKRTKRCRISVSEDEDTKGSTSLSRLYCEPYVGHVYNKSTHNVPAELFRKDLISAMKLPDSEQLQPDEYWLISDPWRQEWEKGVQVPVNPEGIPTACLKTVRKVEKAGEFKLPKNLIRSTHDEFFSNEIHQLHNTASKAEQVCRYDLDDVDVKWLRALNREREEMGLPPVEELTLEKVMEELEIQCHDNIQHAIQTEKGLGIEYDEDVICDVCRSPDSEEGNEMVFCDSCDICVHQACYGIQTIPEGSWVCKTCALGMKPVCLLCPRRGGAMKSTRSGSKWTHVSCALWIPEVSIGCVDKMEPIIKISNIPASRWALICSICRERAGACIQCSVKTCKIAYHVTCAFQHGLEMKAILDDQDSEDGVKLRSYCQKHSKKNGGTLPDSETDGMKIIAKKELTSEERATQRETRLQQIEEDFYKFVKIQEVASTLEVEEEIVDFICEYWKLKRKAVFCKPLLTPKKDEADLLTKQQEDSLYARMKMFVHLRQDLERVRNLCYMVGRREKLSRSWFKIREQIFSKQVSMLSSDSKFSKADIDTILNANHGDTIYDKPYLWEKELNRDDFVYSEYSGITSKEAKTDTTNNINKNYSELNNVPKGCKSLRVENYESDKRFEKNKSQPKNRTRTNGVLDLDKSSKNFASCLQKSIEAISEKERLASSSTINVNGKNSKCKQSSRFGSINKDLKMQEMSPNREKLRQESIKVRESLFTNQGSPRALSGYKIPKKSKNDISVSSFENHDQLSPDKDQNLEGNIYSLETRSSSHRLQNDGGRHSVNWQFEHDSQSVYRTPDKSSHTKELRKSTSDSNSFEQQKENEISDFRTMSNHKYDGSEASQSDCDSETSNTSQTNYNQRRVPKTYAMRSRLFETANKISASGYR